MSKNLTPHGNDKQSESSSVCSVYSVREKITESDKYSEGVKSVKICRANFDKVKERIKRRNIYQCYQCNLWEKKIHRRSNFRDLRAFRERKNTP